MLYRETSKIQINGEEVDYTKPGMVQVPYISQWIIQGLAPTFLTESALQEMTKTEIYEAAIQYVQELNATNVDESEKQRIWGAALITSSATIEYLLPCLSQCFPNLDLGRIEDVILNEIMSVFFTDYFALLSN